MLLLFFIFLGFSQKEINPTAFINNNKFTHTQSGQKKTTRLNFTIFEEEKQNLCNSTNLLNSSDLNLDDTKWKRSRKLIKQDENAGCDTREQDVVEDEEFIIMKLKKQLHIYRLLTILKNPHISQKRKLEAWYEHMDYIEYVNCIEKKSKYVLNLSQGGLFNSWDFDLK